MKKKIGFAMLAAPFVAIAIIGALAIGGLPMLLVFLGCAALVAWIAIGATLAF